MVGNLLFIIGKIFNYEPYLLTNQIIINHNFSLLAQNQVADFHTEIERLDHEEIQNDPYIKHPIQIEQYLMEGNYNKVLMSESFLETGYSTFFKLFLAQSNIPSESYGYFIEILLQTIRGEIGSCLEKAYATMDIDEASRLLHLKSVKELQVRKTSLSKKVYCHKNYFTKKAIELFLRSFFRITLNSGTGKLMVAR